MNEYYLILDGAQHGPFTLNQVRSMWQAGKINLQTKFFQQGLDDWQPMSMIVDQLENEATGTNPTSAWAPMPQPTSRRDAQTAFIKPAKSRGIYIILGLFLGLMGIHNFYAGHYKNAVIQLVIFLLLGWILVGLLINFIWVLVEMFTVKVDGQGDPML